MEQLDFPLFHGTSTLYENWFKAGSAPKLPWPYREPALRLLREVTKEIANVNGKIEFWITDTLQQQSGHSNWQHGELYLTPSRYSAAKYARTGGQHGGELLRMCSDELERLASCNRQIHDKVRSGAGELLKFLEGKGQPMLVVFEDLCLGDLEAERCAVTTVEDMLKNMPQASDEFFDVLTQQTNFRLKPGRGRISRVEFL